MYKYEITLCEGTPPSFNHCLVGAKFTTYDEASMRMAAVSSDLSMFLNIIPYEEVNAS